LKKQQKRSNKHNSDVEVRVFEFNCNIPFSSESYKPLFDELDKLDDISILVNNVGYAPRFGLEYHGANTNDLTSLSQITLNPLMYLSRYCLGRMINRGEKKSAMINISSITSFMPVPGSTIYSGAKGFMNRFTESLSNTPVYKNIDFLCLTPASVKSSMNEGKQLFTVDAYDYARQLFYSISYLINSIII
jgi:short-subunit dehydrogenase